ncbi:anti sigma factor C-terminal domain-containing protein [Paenibacillus sp. y28]|uniref:anti sigma factor C-terminal domain-containing protein n=1 Tax=Paenibacillus sp. y28 TaxID=3129110 RepID=UPI003015E8B6
MEMHLSGQGKAFFTAALSGPLKKKIGDRHETVGQYSLGLLLSRPGLERISWTTDIQVPYFHRPGSARLDSSQAWAQLEKLPEGTVAEAYVSLNRLFGTGELLKQLENKPMSPVWFAVDTGLQDEKDVEIVYHPVGFPAYPIWHHQDMQVRRFAES